MKKIVINKCYGGFGLSHKAIMRYAELKGIKLYPWVKKRTLEIYEVETMEELMKKTDHPSIHYTTVSKEEYMKLEKQNKSNDVYFCSFDIDRTDDVLIQVIKEMGIKANCFASDLKIIEIPINVEYTIEEYDGIEWVAEKHRTWN